MGQVRAIEFLCACSQNDGANQAPSRQSVEPAVGICRCAAATPRPLLGSAEKHYPSPAVRGPPGIPVQRPGGKGGSPCPWISAISNNFSGPWLRRCASTGSCSWPKASFWFCSVSRPDTRWLANLSSNLLMLNTCGVPLGKRQAVCNSPSTIGLQQSPRIVRAGYCGQASRSGGWPPRVGPSGGASCFLLCGKHAAHMAHASLMTHIMVGLAFSSSLLMRSRPGHRHS